MNRAVRRTGTYFHCSYAGFLDTRVRAPNTTVPMPGNSRRQLTPSPLRTPCCMSVIRPHATTPLVPLIVVSRPAGALPTLHEASSRANIPATKPLGGETNRCCVSGSMVSRYGK